jgi:hypothetical protein
MKKNRAIQLAGSATELAKVLGITQGAVSQWGEDIPELRVLQLRERRPEWFLQVNGQPSIVSNRDHLSGQGGAHA